MTAARKVHWPSLLALLAVILLGLHLRLTVVIGSQVEAPLRADAGQYYAYAFNLANHGTYSRDLSTLSRDQAPKPDHLRNPGYSLLLLPFAHAVPSDRVILHITLLQALLSSICILVAYLLARRALPRVWSLGVAALTGLSPHLINVNIYILSETAAALGGLLFCLMLARALAANSQAQGSARGVGWLLCGLMLAVATLVRPTFQWFLPVALMLVALQSGARLPVRPVVLVCLGFVLGMAPWWLRNLLQFGELSNPQLMITTLQHGSYPDFLFEGRPETFGYPYRFDPRTSEITASLHSVLGEILRKFREAPLEHLHWYLIGKPLMLWSWSNDAQGSGDVFIYPVLATPFAEPGITQFPHLLMRPVHESLVAIALLGALLAWSPRLPRFVGPTERWVIRANSAMLVYATVIHMAGAPFPRYSIPFLPLIYLQALWTLRTATWAMSLLIRRRDLDRTAR